MDTHWIQVSGGKEFEENRWGEAFLYYLFGTWSDDSLVTNRPKINFGNKVTLQLIPETKQYHVCGSSLDEMEYFKIGECIEVGPAQVEVEQALIRFVKNDKTRQFSIIFKEPTGVFSIWKTDKRGEYRCSVWGVPLSFLQQKALEREQQTNQR